MRVAFCIPGDITLPTGGYRYDREILPRLRAFGLDASHIKLPGSFPDPKAADIRETSRLLSEVERQALLLIDGLALGAMPPDMTNAFASRLVALVHHPLGLEAGIPPERAAFLLINERAVLSHVRHVIVTSHATARTLIADFDVPANRITVAEPGTERARRSVGTGKPLHILAVGAVSARKAYGDLVKALAASPVPDWRLTIAGSLTLSPGAVADLRSVISASSVADRITLTGALDDAALGALYATADIFAMSSLYEGYGMALTEALAHGLPIITSSGGAAAETVPDSAAIKVPPGELAALTAALATVMSDEGRRRRMADAAWAAAALLPTWDDTAATIADALKAL